MSSGPWFVPAHDIIRRPGEAKDFDLDVIVPEAFGNAVIAVPAGDELQISGRLESLHDGVLVSAEITGVAAGECVRCLIPVTEAIDVDFQELFGYPGTSDFDGPDSPDLDYEVQGDGVDLEQVVRDTVVPALPFQPICQEDCEGLCPICGVRLLDHPGHQHDAPVDPRWTALQGIDLQQTALQQGVESDDELPE